MACVLGNCEASGRSFAASRRMRLVLVVCALAGCGARYRSEFIGTGDAVVLARTTAGATVTGGIPVPRGSYDIALRFAAPRAQVIDWRVRCPGADLTGTVGETADA